MTFKTHTARGLGQDRPVSVSTVMGVAGGKIEAQNFDWHEKMQLFMQQRL